MFAESGPQLHQEVGQRHTTQHTQQPQAGTASELISLVSREMAALCSKLGATFSVILNQHPATSCSSSDDSRNPPLKRTKETDSGFPLHPLEHNPLLSMIFAYVGFGHWLYVASVNRQFRGVYLTFCYNWEPQRQHKPHTYSQSAMLSAARFEMAMRHGLRMQDLTLNVSKADKLHQAVAAQGLQFAKLAREFGMQWDLEHSRLFLYAAEAADVELLDCSSTGCVLLKSWTGA